MIQVLTGLGLCVQGSTPMDLFAVARCVYMANSESDARREEFKKIMIHTARK